MSRITFFGTSGDIDVSLKYGSGGACIYLEPEDILINPGLGVLIRSAHNKIDLHNCRAVCISSKKRIFQNELEILQEIAEVKVIIKEEIIQDAKIIPIAIKESTAFRINTQRFVLSYIPQLSKKHFDEFKDSNIIILECPDDLDMKLICELVKELEPELLLLTAYGKKIMHINPLEYAREIKKALQTDDYVLKTQIMPTKDSTSINPENYNIRIKQKILKGWM